jgi:hypothetical protein
MANAMGDVIIVPFWNRFPQDMHIHSDFLWCALFAYIGTPIHYLRAGYTAVCVLYKYCTLLTVSACFIVMVTMV